jgi:hypothetical protein
VEERQIEESVREAIEDMKEKIGTLMQMPETANDETARKIDAVRNKAVKAFNDACTKLSALSESVFNEEETAKAVETVKVRSKELYENAISRIDALLLTNSENNSGDERKSSEEDKHGLDELIGNVGDQIGDFINKEEVKRAIESTKEGVSEVSGKALEILKEWLAPEGDDK